MSVLLRKSLVSPEASQVVLRGSDVVTSFNFGVDIVGGAREVRVRVPVGIV